MFAHFDTLLLFANTFFLYRQLNCYCQLKYSVPNLEKELADLIVSGQISARIDSHNKRLYATQSDQRTATFDKSYNAADDFRSQSMAMLLRINLIRNGFVVKGAKGQGGAGMDIMDIPMAFGGFGGMAGLMSGMGRSHKGR